MQTHRFQALSVHVLGAGVAGLTTALRLAEAGREVVVHERAAALGARAASWLAGGMLAPFCEAATAGEPALIGPGLEGIDWWSTVTEVHREGTLVLAGARDAADLRQFAARAGQGGVSVGEERIAELEPDLAGRFRTGLLFEREAHLDPRRALAALRLRIEAAGGTLLFGSDAEPAAFAGEDVVDCRGVRADLARLRGVRGEMVLVRSSDVRLNRPVRLLHPRWPIYVVPRGEGVFMVGATMLESAGEGPITLRSAVELLSAAVALHPALAEAEILEMGANLRPALPDNLPDVRREGRVVRFSGLYRHGFLLSPSYSRRAAELLEPLSSEPMEIA